MMEVDLKPIPIEPSSNEIFAKIMPMLFVGEIFYPQGGWRDFEGFFKTVKSAQEWVEKNYPDASDKWAHIVYGQKIVLYGLNSDESLGKWIWGKDKSQRVF